MSSGSGTAASLTGATYYATDDRPPAPDLDGARCEVAGCAEPATVHCWTEEYQEWFRFCAPHAERQTATYEDLEVVPDV